MTIDRNVVIGHFSKETTKSLKKLAMGSGLMALATAGALASPAFAQTAQSSSFDGIEDIVVTAQKREESLQETPISIGVLSSGALEERGLKSLNDFVSGAVPSLRIAPFVGRASAITIGMRGLVPTDATQLSRDPTVGVYVDGVYLGRVQGLGTELVDVERIEVLRGPQGTLFGRNAVGGALSIVSKKPTGEFGMDLTVGVRSLNGRNIAAHVNLPEVAGFSVKLDGVYNKRGGWTENQLPGQWDWNAFERYGFRAAVLWQPADTITIQYAYDRSTDKSTGGYPHIERLLPGAPPLAPMFTVDDGRQRQARGGFVLDPSVGKVHGHMLNAEWEVSDTITLRSITAYRKLDQTQYDASAGAFIAYRPNGTVGRYSYAGVKQDQFSQELQIIGTTDQLKYVLGAFYFDEDGSDDAFAPFTAQYNATGTAISQLPTPVASTPFPDRASEAHTKSKALFGQATWTPSLLDDRLHLTGGLRYTDDKKNGRLNELRGVPANIGFTFSSKRVDPAATIAFDVNDNVNTYLRWGVAYRAGGANSRSSIFRTFGEESVSSWELGLKSDLFDRRVRLNLAAYYSRLKNIQLDFANPANPSNTETVNGTRDAKIKGVEADLTIAPGGGFTLNGSYSFTDVKIPDQLNPFTNSFSDLGVGQTPRHAATMALDYRFPDLSIGTLSAHIDGNWSSGIYSTGSDPTRSNRVVLLNGRLTLADIAMGSGTVEVSLWGKNLTNAEYTVFDFELTGRGLITANQAYYNEPRTYGAEMRFRF